jgi:hypothetical protein
MKNKIPWVLTATKCDAPSYQNNNTTINSVYNVNLKHLTISLSSSVTCQPEIDMFRPRLIVSSKVFQAVFIHLVYNSALFCCSFLLHVANCICFYLVYWQLVLLSNLPKFLHSICGQEGCTRLASENFHLNWCHFCILFSSCPNFASVQRMGWASTLYTSILETFWTKVDLEMLVGIPSIWENVARFF